MHKYVRDAWWKNTNLKTRFNKVVRTVADLYIRDQSLKWQYYTYVHVRRTPDHCTTWTLITPAIYLCGMVGWCGYNTVISEAGLNLLHTYILCIHKLCWILSDLCNFSTTPREFFIYILVRKVADGEGGVCDVCVCVYSCVHVQRNLWIIDTLGLTILSIIERLSIVQRLKMY